MDIMSVVAGIQLLFQVFGGESGALRLLVKLHPYPHNELLAGSD